METQQQPVSRMSRAHVIAAALTSAAAATILAACSSGGTMGVTSTGSDTTVDHITMSIASTTLTPGQQVTILATAVNASDSALARTFTWSSNAAAVATVTQGGVVTAVAAGMATITAATGTKSAQSMITVSTTTGTSHVWADLSAGYDYTTCGRTTDGSSWCWGHNIAGQLGDGDTFNQLVPTMVSGGLTFAELVTGTSRSCGRTAAGAAYCWGLSVTGDGTTNQRLAPALVTGGLSFVQLAVGQFMSCGRTSAGAAYCWGDPSSGDGTATTRLTPTAVSGGLTFADISTTGVFACGRTAAGAVWCWGDNTSGEIGDGTIATSRLVPTAVAGGLAFSHLATAYAHACAATSSGTTWCWGGNSYGELGNGTANLRDSIPTLVSGGLSFSQLATGTRHSCGLTTAGAAYCWGDNTFGQLGDGTTVAHLTPTLVTGGIAFTKLVAGHLHTCGMTAAGAAYCWGDNVYGEIGDNTSTNRLVPTAVH